MNRIGPVLVAALAVVATVGALPVPGGASADVGSAGGPAAGTADRLTPPAANRSVPPGARLAGVVGVGQAELEGAIDVRAFGLAIAGATTDAARAAILMRHVGQLEERLRELERRKQALQSARANGTISEAAYRARIAELAARAATLRSLANLTTATASRLPADVLAAEGVNATAIRSLERRAANLTGPEVAAIARSIAGPDVGRPVADAGAADGNGPAVDRRDGDNATRPTAPAGEPSAGPGAADQPRGGSTRRNASASGPDTMAVDQRRSPP
ncbi:MAG: hypothetical protein ABEJ92_03465 [Halobacteriales archaeon]